MKEKKEKDPSKRGRPKKRKPPKRSIDERKVPKPAELFNISKKDQILAIKLKTPHITNVQIGEIVGCCESTVRYFLKGEYAKRVEEGIQEHFAEKILTLQSKAFNRLNDMLDDPKTPPAVVAQVCKFLLEKFISVEKNANANMNEMVEFETIITDTGSIQQIRRKIGDKLEAKEKTINIDAEFSDENQS